MILTSGEPFFKVAFVLWVVWLDFFSVFIPSRQVFFNMIKDTGLRRKGKANF